MGFIKEEGCTLLYGNPTPKEAHKFIVITRLSITRTRKAMITTSTHHLLRNGQTHTTNRT